MFIPPSPLSGFFMRVFYIAACSLRLACKIRFTVSNAFLKLKVPTNTIHLALVSQVSQLIIIIFKLLKKLLMLSTALSEKINFDISERNRIRRLRGNFKGNRCFIIATGPSLNRTRIESLSGEYTFAVKSYLFSGIDRFHLIPSFFCWSDRGTLLDKLHLFPSSQPEGMLCFFPIALKAKVLKHLRWNRSSLYFIRDVYEWNVQKGLFSTDADHLLHCSGTVIIDYCIPLAIYMGFNPIYLVGCDQSSPGGIRHFDGNSRPLSGISTSWEAINEAFKVVNKYAIDHGVTILNATPGGELDVFERVNFDDIVD